MNDPLEALLTTEGYEKGHNAGYEAGKRAMQAPESFLRLSKVLLRYEYDLKAIRRASLADAFTLRRIADTALLAGAHIRETGSARGAKRSQMDTKAT